MEQTEDLINKIYGMQTSFVGQRYAGANLSNLRLDCDVEKLSGPNAEEIMKKASDYLKSPKGFLLYISPPGGGKTYFCSACLGWMYSKVNTLYYTDEQRFFGEMRGYIDKGWDYFKGLTDKYDHELLIFDDLGSSMPNEWRQEVLFSLINFRYLNQLPTIFTSNIVSSSLKDIVGERGASRLLSAENTLIIRENAIDLRKKGL